MNPTTTPETAIKGLRYTHLALKGGGPSGDTGYSVEGQSTISRFGQGFVVRDPNGALFFTPDTNVIFSLVEFV